MSDKIRLVENASDPHPHPAISRRWLIFLAIALGVILLLGWFLLSNSTQLDGVKRFFRYTGKASGYGSIKLEPLSNADYTLVKDHLVLGTQGSVTVFSDDGSVLGKLTNESVTPALRSQGSALLSYDIGGKHLAVLNSTGDTNYVLDTESRIYDADLSERGAVSLLTEGSDCRAVLKVYNHSGDLLFRRSSKTSYLNTCAISPDGSYVATTTLGQENLNFSCMAQIFETDSDSVYTELSLGNQIIYDLAFLDDSTLCAVGDGRMVFFHVNGEVVGEYAAATGKPLAYSFQGDGFVTVLFDSFESDNRYYLMLLDKTGKIISSVAMEEPPLSVSANGRYVAVLTESTLQIYNNELFLQNSTPNMGYLTACVRSDGTAFCISATKATLYIP